MEQREQGKRTRRTFSLDFKAEAVRLCRMGDRSISQVAGDLGLTESNLRQWVRQADVDAGGGSSDALMGYNPSRFRGGPDAGQCPVERVSFYEAVAFCNGLSEQQGLAPCYSFDRIQGQPGDDNFSIGEISFNAQANGYHLPTEAQWEYAARAGSTEATYGARDDVAWFRDNSGQSTHAVGQKAANAWGLHDMLGNVFEWVWDWYHRSPGEGLGIVEDPHGPESGSLRVRRGGDWCSPERGVRVAIRHNAAPDARYGGLGLRPARSVD